MNENDRSHNEIVIVRRVMSDHDEHHGGVWKIAFADFMTAMMAFFLVMWLINASNEETKKGVASYFNPIKLTDRVSNPKGVQNPKYGATTKKDEEPEEENTIISNPDALSTKANVNAESFDEKALFSDPYALLTEIASGINSQKDDPNLTALSEPDSSQGMGLSGGEAFQDPFDPKAWNLTFGTPMGNEDTANSTSNNNHLQMKQPSSSPDHANEEPGNKEEKLSTTNNKAAIASSHPSDDTDTNETKADKAEAAKKIIELREAVVAAVNKLDRAAPKIEIISDGSGALIILSDTSKTGMFNVGSARPTKELVKIMADIGKNLAEMDGRVTISGHTDGRKYGSGDYDNWRLSTARAHMAYHMLVRGGLPETRVEKIEGHAAEKLVAPGKPYSAVNRRIELYVRRP